MSEPTTVLSVRVTQEDLAVIRQAVEGLGLDVADWHRATLREAAITQVYGKGTEFPAAPGEIALLRAVLVILQMVGRDVTEDDKRRFADTAARQIEKIKDGE